MWINLQFCKFTLIHCLQQIGSTCTESADASTIAIATLPARWASTASNVNTQESTALGEHSRHCWLYLYALLAASRVVLSNNWICHQRRMLEHDEGIFYAIRWDLSKAFHFKVVKIVLLLNLGFTHSAVSPILHWILNYNSLRQSACQPFAKLNSAQRFLRSHLRFTGPPAAPPSSTNEAALGPFNPKFIKQRPQIYKPPASSHYLYWI